MIPPRPDEVAARRAPLRRQLANMKPCSHWPDRSRPFDPDRSEVLAHICGLMPEFYPEAMALTPAERLREAARLLFSQSTRKTVRFDRRTRLWSGVNHGKESQA